MTVFRKKLGIIQKSRESWGGLPNDHFITYALLFSKSDHERGEGSKIPKILIMWFMDDPLSILFGVFTVFKRFSVPPWQKIALCCRNFSFSSEKRWNNIPRIEAYNFNFIYTRTYYLLKLEKYYDCGLPIILYFFDN